MAYWDEKDSWNAGMRKIAGTLGREAKLAHWNEQITRPLGHLVHWEEKERRHKKDSWCAHWDENEHGKLRQEITASTLA